MTYRLSGFEDLGVLLGFVLLGLRFCLELCNVGLGCLVCFGCVWCMCLGWFALMELRVNEGAFCFCL